ncbi:hypothetical protein NLC35_00305 [Candidatus Aminicenantes bacterium AC-334-K16]|nr:hypothetical protein [Candidatus Aminicenantes bacterium AC-334-K16]
MAYGKIDIAKEMDLLGIIIIKAHLIMGKVNNRIVPIIKAIEIEAVCMTNDALISSFLARYFATNFTTLPERPNWAMFVTDVVAKIRDQIPSFSTPIVNIKNRYKINKIIVIITI